MIAESISVQNDSGGYTTFLAALPDCPAGEHAFVNSFPHEGGRWEGSVFVDCDPIVIESHCLHCGLCRTQNTRRGTTRYERREA